MYSLTDLEEMLNTSVWADKVKFYYDMIEAQAELAEYGRLFTLEPLQRRMIKQSKMYRMFITQHLIRS